MNSFNVYGQTEQVVGGNTPVWLGTVKPIPRGGYMTISNGESKKAGKAAIYDPNTNRVSVIDSTDNGGMLATANCYIYNDVVCREGTSHGSGTVDATCAVVMHHPEGLLIERVYPDITEEQIAQLQSQIPGVLLVRG